MVFLTFVFKVSLIKVPHFWLDCKIFLYHESLSKQTMSYKYNGNSLNKIYWLSNDHMISVNSLHHIFKCHKIKSQTSQSRGPLSLIVVSSKEPWYGMNQMSPKSLWSKNCSYGTNLWLIHALLCGFVWPELVCY